MEIVIVGKGGSGKTTLAATIVRARSEKGKTVLAIDADIKQHLASTLGYSAELIGAMKWRVDRDDPSTMLAPLSL
jgi:CO dehydrogenase maturation factor